MKKSYGEPTSTIGTTYAAYTVTKNEGGINVDEYDVVLSLVDSANYKWSDGSEDASKTLKFNITKAEVTVPTIESKVYNGTPQKADVEETSFYTVTNEGGTLVGGYSVVLTLKDPTNYKWSDVDGAAKELTFTITRKTVTITADSSTKVYDGASLTENTYTNTALATGDSVKSVTVTGSQTVVGTSENVPSAAVIINSDGEDVTASYEITYANGTLQVTQKALTITADKKSKEYDGAELKENSYTHTSLSDGDSIESVTVTGSQTVVGTSSNVPSAAIIKNSNGDDVTASYNITYVNNTLEVTPKKITITADDGTKIYDGTPLTKTTYILHFLALFLNRESPKKKRIRILIYRKLALRSWRPAVLWSCVLKYTIK